MTGSHCIVILAVIFFTYIILASFWSAGRRWVVFYYQRRIEKLLMEFHFEEFERLTHNGKHPVMDAEIKSIQIEDEKLQYFRERYLNFSKENRILSVINVIMLFVIIVAFLLMALL